MTGNNFHLEVIGKNAKKVLDKLARKFDYIDKIYLAGGTAMALYLGHRKSYDLDFFSQHKFNKEEIIGNLKSNFNLEIENTDRKTLIAALDGIRFSLFYYDYPLIGKLEKISGIKVASLKDISAMKLAAISQRGAKRDFVDIYFVFQIYGLNDILEFYEKKYKAVSPNIYNVLKSLVYFEDAEIEKMPVMLKNVSWEKVKSYLVSMLKMYRKDISNLK